MSKKKHILNVLGALPEGSYAEQGRKHMKFYLPNGRFITGSGTPKDTDTAFRHVLRQAKRELQR